MSDTPARSNGDQKSGLLGELQEDLRTEAKSWLYLGSPTHRARPVKGAAEEEVGSRLSEMSARTEMVVREGDRAPIFRDHCERSILIRGFHAELVPQEPVVEPAVVMQARLTVGACRRGQSRCDASAPSRGRRRPASAR